MDRGHDGRVRRRSTARAAATREGARRLPRKCAAAREVRRSVRGVEACEEGRKADVITGSDGVAAVAPHLRNAGRAVVLAGSASGRQRWQAVAALAPGVLDLSGQTTLSELAALIRRAELCVTNDSGSMHLTVALDKPVVSIFGPTDPLWIGPYGRPHAVVRADVPCSPCYLRKLRSCPHGHASSNFATAPVIGRHQMRAIAPSGDFVRRGDRGRGAGCPHRCGHRCRRRERPGPSRRSLPERPKA